MTVVHPEANQGASPAILVVEDDVAMRAFVSDLLLDEGYTVRVVASGDEALTELDRSVFDAIILDLYLPGVSGFEVCVYIRTKISSKVPILIVTAYDGIHGVSDLMRAGANDYLRKPLDADVLVRRLEWLVPKGASGTTLNEG